MATMTGITTMKAVTIHRYGGPEVLSYEDVPRPEPSADELLVRVHAAGVNPVDWKIREGLLGKAPLPQILGSDFSGVVEAHGTEVKGFNIGDPVFGVVAEESGSYAEFCLAPPKRVAIRPLPLDDVHAAALPTASLTAWQALFDVAHLAAGQKVLIHAAAGGVGGFAVQFAKWKGAYVIGTASGPGVDFVRGLGADQVIDYHTTRFEEVVRDVDVVLDTIGGETQERSWQVLKRGGILVSLVKPPDQQKAAALGVRGEILYSKSRGDQLAQIAELVVSGKVKVHVEKVLPLREARQAQELSQSGHVRGKIVLVIDSQGG
ncbi:MAG: Alcohol dehydrogenase zinc-binding domain protein [Pedosphaera sp.]|nr:Alcohol dehydrogenase zinc-binding domain protein [Pedosphaera sp.]